MYSELVQASVPLVPRKSFITIWADFKVIPPPSAPASSSGYTRAGDVQFYIFIFYS
jgi:hypothetical protein